MKDKFDVRTLLPRGALVLAFLLGLLFSGAASRGQYMSSEVTYCTAPCSAPARGQAPCPDVCSGVPAGDSCTCSCSADNLSGQGECFSGCDYGTPSGAYCDF